MHSKEQPEVVAIPSHYESDSQFIIEERGVENAHGNVGTGGRAQTSSAYTSVAPL